MTTKKFIRLLEKELADSFVLYTNKDKYFDWLSDEEIVLAGENEDETFGLLITKV